MPWRWPSEPGCARRRARSPHWTPSRRRAPDRLFRKRTPCRSIPDLAAVARRLASAGLPLGIVEFDDQPGLRELARLMDDVAVFVHSIPPDELERLDRRAGAGPLQPRHAGAAGPGAVRIRIAAPGAARRRRRGAGGGRAGGALGAQHRVRGGAGGPGAPTGSRGSGRRSRCTGGPAPAWFPRRFSSRPLRGRFWRRGSLFE